jgi:hypothetical protein
MLSHVCRAGSVGSLCRRVNPDWPQASGFLNRLRDGMNGTKLQEPTQEMVLNLSHLSGKSSTATRMRC